MQFLKRVDGALKGFVDHLIEMASHLSSKEHFYLNQISTLSEELAAAQDEVASAKEQVSSLKAQIQELKVNQADEIERIKSELQDHRQSQKTFLVQEHQFREINETQERAIEEIIAVSKRELDEVSLTMINKAQQSLEKKQKALTGGSGEGHNSLHYIYNYNNQ